MNPFRRPGRSQRGANSPEGQIIQATPQTPVSGHPGSPGAGSGQSPVCHPAKSPENGSARSATASPSAGQPEPRLGEAVKINYVTKLSLFDIVEIERRSFKRPLSRAALEELINRRNVMGISARHYDSVIGYAIYEFLDFHIDLLMLVVDPRDRRLGVGSRLIEELKSKMGTRRWLLRCDLTDDNLDGHLFLKANGFLAKGVLKDLNGDPSIYRFQTTHRDVVREREGK